MINLFYPFQSVYVHVSVVSSFRVQDSSGIFWDNDSLSALLALELKADLLVLLSDVEGLYSGPPSDPHSKLIHTYIKEKHQNEITFGDKSRVGRGGMTAKVKAAVHAADAGIPVVITRYTILLRKIVTEHSCLGFSFPKNSVNLLLSAYYSAVFRFYSKHFSSVLFSIRNRLVRPQQLNIMFC